ncbi:hypothetical protein [Rhodovulum sp. PH10]|uniref:hypothetical protein n=1 Tax=Rhodovulum sp. PH10 TaxID=1187851 RepID=UPI00058C509A|nr:hypothetical protein [Rhodovulum sp. PH10]
MIDTPKSPPWGSPEWIAKEREFRERVDALIARAYELSADDDTHPLQLIAAAAKLMLLRQSWPSS